MSIDQGGPAFPWCGDLNDCPTINLGMTLRDYFAAKAMDTFFSNFLKAAQTSQKSPTKEEWGFMAEACYGAADAMLEARK